MTGIGERDIAVRLKTQKNGCNEPALKPTVETAIQGFKHPPGSDAGVRDERRTPTMRDTFIAAFIPLPLTSPSATIVDPLSRG